MSRFLHSAYQPMKAYVPGEQPKRQDILKLNTNESPYPPSPKVAESLGAGEIERLRLYSDLTSAPLTEAISAHYHISVSQIIVGNGSDELLAFAMMAFGEDGAVFPDITYGFYTVWADLFRIGKRIIPLRDDFTIDPDHYRADDGMVLIANPNAPTGMALTVDQIRRILASNPHHVVLVDEAYVDFGGESSIPLLNEFENLLIVKTFSKSRSLAGGRIGYAFGSEELIADMNKIRFSFHPYNMGTLPMLAGAAAMRDAEYFNACRMKIIENRIYTTEALETLGFEILPSKANFIFARPPRIDGRAYVRKLYERGILVRRFDLARIEDFARITIGTKEQMARFIAETKDILRREGVL